MYPVLRMLLFLSLLSLPVLVHGSEGGSCAQQNYVIYAAKQSEESRIDALESRVRALENDSKGTKTPAVDRGATAFNPAISAILMGQYGHFSLDPEEYAIPGFVLGEEAGPGVEGLSLSESELVLSANVDDKFYARFTLALTPENEAEVEEAFFQTLALPAGFTLQGGRFWSDIGYLNRKHPHQWDFVDTALPYRAMLGGQYGDDGVQVRWLAPVDLFVELGSELFRGDSFPAAGAANSGTGTYTVFAHVGGDVGASHSWRAGISYLDAEAEDRDTDGLVFNGTSRIVIGDFIWKWAPRGNPYRKNFTVQAEYMSRREDGTYTGTVTGPYDAEQSGWYAQAIYQFMPRWRFGGRYDRLRADDPGAAFAGTDLDPAGHTPERVSAMIDFSNSEYSRFRVQYNIDDSRPERDRQFFVQYIMSLGAHGAHRF